MPQAAAPIITQLNELCAKYGLEPLEADTKPDMRALESRAHYSAICELAELVQEEVGAPGQRMMRGQLQTDPNSTYGPAFVRGRYGNPGLYEEIYRTEPLVYDAIRTHAETLVSGTWVIEPPPPPPYSKRSKAEQRRLEKWCAWHNGKLAHVVGGWNKAVESMCSMLLYGFAAHELVWGLDTSDAKKPRPFIHKIAFRYPATVYEWIMDERQSELLGVHFKSFGPGGVDYKLAAICPPSRPWERKVLIQSLGGWGNDFEGVAPLRPVVVLWKIKRLLLQIAALAADTYGIPLTVLMVDPVALANNVPAPAKEDMDKVWNALKNYTALDAARLKLPPGLKIESISPSGAMPDFSALIDYLDRMMLVPFSNEGSLLGLVGGGAYALGVVKEREQLRTAPYYARLIIDPLNEVLRDIARYELGELDAYPQLVWRMDGVEDGSAWIKDALSAIQLPLADWPLPAREVATAKLGLPDNTFEQHDRDRQTAQAQAQMGQGQAAAGEQDAPAEQGASVTQDASQDGPERPVEEA